MTFRLRRGMVSETGPGYAITDANGYALPGRWPTYEEAHEQGYLGMYLFSGVDIVELVDVDGRLMVRECG